MKLEAQILRPTLHVSPSQFDFGTVHVKDHRTIRICIANPTKVDAKWNIKHVPTTFANSSADVFAFSQVSGILPGPTVPENSGLVQSKPPKGKSRFFQGLPFEMNVTFQPGTSKRYSTTFRFVVEKGNSFDLTLSGQGTFDEDFIHSGGGN